MIGLALRTFVRYLVPIAIATFLAVAPFAAIALWAPWPRDVPTANLAIARAFVLAGMGWAVTLLVVAAVAPLVRSVASGDPLSQPRALVASAGNLVRMALPCLAAIAAIVIGALALVVPAFVLLVLLSLTGASTERGMPAPLADSVAIVRARWRPIAAIVGVMFVVDIAIAFAAWKLFAVPFAPKLKPAQWATYGNIARITVAGIAVTSPVFATLLAAARR